MNKKSKFVALSLATAALCISAVAILGRNNANLLDVSAVSRAVKSHIITFDTVVEGSYTNNYKYYSFSTTFKDSSGTTQTLTSDSDFSCVSEYYGENNIKFNQQGSLILVESAAYNIFYFGFSILKRANFDYDASVVGYKINSGSYQSVKFSLYDEGEEYNFYTAELNTSTGGNYGKKFEIVEVKLAFSCTY